MPDKDGSQSGDREPGKYFESAKGPIDFGLDSDARIPRVAKIRRLGIESRDKAFEGVRDHQPVYKFDALIAQLARHAQTEWAAERDRQIPVVHGPSQKSLWMLRVGHIDAIPPIGVDGEIHDISRFGQHLAGPEHLKQRGADPLGDVRPSLLTHNFSDLAAYGKALEIGQGKRRRSGHHSIDDKSPIRKTAVLQALEGFVQGRDLVSERNLRNHAAWKPASERVS